MDFGYGDILNLIGMGTSLYASSKQSDAIEERGAAQADQYTSSAKANAEISRYDAIVEENEALSQMFSTNQQVAQHRKTVEGLLGQQRARYGKSGVAVGTGTPLEVAQSTLQEGQTAENTIKYNGRKSAQLHKTLAQRFRNLADVGLTQASSLAAYAMEAAASESNVTMLNAYGTLTGQAYRYGETQEWWR